MPEYIDISEIPVRHSGGRWVKMLDEFPEIPPGKALEITSKLDGLQAKTVAWGLRGAMNSRNVTHLIVVCRGDRLFIMRPEEAQP